jgi:hypothetical protein
MRIAWQRLNKGGCIPRIAKVVDLVDIARVLLASMPADVGALVGSATYCRLRGQQ